MLHTIRVLSLLKKPGHAIVNNGVVTLFGNDSVCVARLLLQILQVKHLQQTDSLFICLKQRFQLYLSGGRWCLCLKMLLLCDVGTGC